MARLDPLAPDPGLNLPRFGHAPALWLALPLLLGCALDQAWRPEAGAMLLGGASALVVGAWAVDRTPLALAALALAASAPFAADAPAWDVNGEHGPTKTVRFTTDEGTWLDLDVAPDGRTMVFSMLGDLYRLPIAGGRATRLTSGPAWDV